MASLPLGRGRRLALPRPVNWLLWAGVAAGLVAGLLTWQATTAARPAVEVLAFTRTLEPGAVLTAEDVAPTGVLLEPRLLAEHVPSAELGKVVGATLGERAYAGTLLTRPQLAAGDRLARGQVGMSVAVAPQNAAAGAVRAGSPVMVVIQGKAGAEVALERVTVRDVVRAGGLTVTLTLTEAQMRRLMEARTRGEVNLLLLPTEPGADATASGRGAAGAAP